MGLMTKIKKSLLSLLSSNLFSIRNIIISIHRFYPDGFIITYKINKFNKVTYRDFLFFIVCTGKLCYISFKEKSCCRMVLTLFYIEWSGPHE